MLQVALVFLWLVCGLFMADLGLIYMMVLKNYLQYEKRKRGKSREAGKQPSTAAQKLEKEESKKNREQRSREAGRAERTWKQQSGDAERQHSGEAEHQKSGKAEKQRTTKAKKQGKTEKQNEQRSRKTKITKRNAQNGKHALPL